MNKAGFVFLYRRHLSCIQYTIQYTAALGVVLFVVVVFEESGGGEGVEGHREEMGEQ